MKILAVIPARGGSKRIPHKNIKSFEGRPIIGYSIDVAKQSGLFDEVMVSTEDNEIAEIAKNLGASIPFLRSNDTAGDKCGLAEVILEVIDSYSKIGREFDYCCCIFAAAPFITIERLKEAFDKIVLKNYDSVMPIIPYPVPIQQAFKLIPESDTVEMFFDDQAGIMTQDYVPSFYDAGQFYWINIERLKVKGRIDGENTGAIILSELEAHDIDTEDDWKIAEQKYSYIKNSNQEIKSKKV